MKKIFNLIFQIFNIRNINPHITQMHSDLKRFQCGYCGKRWKDVQNLKLHLTNHSSVDTLICTPELPANDSNCINSHIVFILYIFQ